MKSPLGTWELKKKHQNRIKRKQEDNKADDTL